MTELRTDPAREKHPDVFSSGIIVRALDSSGQWGSFDVAQLTRESLISWLYSGQPLGRDIQTIVLLAFHHEP